VWPKGTCRGTSSFSTADGHSPPIEAPVLASHEINYSFGCHTGKFKLPPSGGLKEQKCPHPLTQRIKKTQNLLEKEQQQQPMLVSQFTTLPKALVLLLVPGFFFFNASE